MTHPKSAPDNDVRTMLPLELLVAWHEARQVDRNSMRHRALLQELLRRLHAGDRALEEDRKVQAESSDRG